MSLNYDDTLLEPTVLPAKFPNLLVNGSTGISAGYATNIPPHNLGEVIDATIKRIESPNCHLETILDIVKGPDFPTGGIAEGIGGIRDAFTKGRGKVNIKSKYEVIGPKNKRQIIITEIPYEVNKMSLVKKIDDIRIDKKIEGISEVRDETDREGIRIAIDLKKDANEDLIVNYLLKNTDMMISYSYNMVAIVNRRPVTLGIMEILDAYIAHQKDVITRRTKFDLRAAETRMHIVEGLIRALSILDDVIKTIRASKNKADAINNLVCEYDFTQEQATAIVTLQLYRLTNTDVAELEEELKKLEKEVSIYKQILENESALKHVMKLELKIVKEEYATPRKTEIRDEVTEVKIDETSLIPKEDCIVVITNEGYVKRVSMRSFAASKEEATGLKDLDYVSSLYEANTMDILILFTNLGNYLYIPVYQLPDLKWKDLGKHISNIVNISSDENIINSYLAKDFNDNVKFISFSKNGMVKQTSLSVLKVLRYSKPITLMKLKNDDKVVSVEIAKKEVFITTRNRYGLRYDKEDEVGSASSFDEASFVAIITDKKTGKRVRMEEFEKTSRARKGILTIRDVKTNPYRIINSYIINSKVDLGLITDEINYLKITELPICDRYQTGTSISKKNIKNTFIKANMEKPLELPKEEIDLDSIDEKMMTISDFIDDFKAY
jgi:topoisomerase-4 subunit A